MKDAEDEAFDELAKRQGHWGGGFKAKRAMAADKLQEPPSEWASIKAVLDEYGLQAIDFVADFKAALAQPAPQPVAWIEKDVLPLTHIIKAVVRREKDETYTEPLYTAPVLAGREWNFCERCGKRTNNIHTCTPPQGNA